RRVRALRGRARRRSDRRHLRVRLALIDALPAGGAGAENAPVLTPYDLSVAAAVVASAVALGCGASAAPAQGSSAVAGPELDAPPPLALSLMSFNIRYENDIDGEN